MVATVKFEGILIVLEREKQIKRTIIVCAWCEIIILLTSYLPFCLIDYIWMKRKRRMSRLDGRWVSPKQKIRKLQIFLLVQFSVPWKNRPHGIFFMMTEKIRKQPKLSVPGKKWGTCGRSENWPIEKWPNKKWPNKKWPNKKWPNVLWPIEKWLN